MSGVAAWRSCLPRAGRRRDRRAVRGDGRTPATCVDLSGSAGARSTSTPPAASATRSRSCLAPLVAACGVPVAEDLRTRARPHRRHARQARGDPGLPHRARRSKTIDEQVREVGCAIVGQRADARPRGQAAVRAARRDRDGADRIPLIVAVGHVARSSPEGTDAIVLDVKVGCRRVHQDARGRARARRGDGASASAPGAVTRAADRHERAARARRRQRAGGAPRPSTTLRGEAAGGLRRARRCLRRRPAARALPTSASTRPRAAACAEERDRLGRGGAGGWSAGRGPGRRPAAASRAVVVMERAAWCARWRRPPAGTSPAAARSRSAGAARARRRARPQEERPSTTPSAWSCGRQGRRSRRRGRHPGRGARARRGGGRCRGRFRAGGLRDRPDRVERVPVLIETIG